MTWLGLSFSNEYITRHIELHCIALHRIRQITSFIAANHLNECKKRTANSLKSIQAQLHLVCERANQLK